MSRRLVAAVVGICSCGKAARVPDLKPYEHASFDLVIAQGSLNSLRVEMSIPRGFEPTAIGEITSWEREDDQGNHVQIGNAKDTQAFSELDVSTSAPCGGSKEHSDRELKSTTNAEGSTRWTCERPDHAFGRVARAFHYDEGTVWCVFQLEHPSAQMFIDAAAICDSVQVRTWRHQLGAPAPYMTPPRITPLDAGGV